MENFIFCEVFLAKELSDNSLFYLGPLLLILNIEQDFNQRKA